MYRVIVPALLFLPALLKAQVTAGDFARKAYAALPVEESYTFHKTLSEWQEPLRRDPAATPEPSELAIPAQGWHILIPADAGEILKTAAAEFREYLDRSMKTRVTVETSSSIKDWQSARNAIVAGTGAQMPDCGTSLKAKKDYRIVASKERIAICGFDERGAMFGIYDLERRMNLREAPFLPASLTRPVTVCTNSHDTFRTRLGGVARSLPGFTLALRIRFYLCFRVRQS